MKKITATVGISCFKGHNSAGLTRNGAESDSDANLDPEELALEDRLAEEARRTTQGAANEIYHGCVVYT
jgi:hypothetical protein